MADRPLIFSAPMICALIDGRKSQTRRLLNPQPLPDYRPTHFEAVARCKKTGRQVWEAHDQKGPMGGVFPGPPGCLETHAHTPAPGDRFWVREAWRTVVDLDASSPTEIGSAARGAGYAKPWAPICFEADGRKVNWGHVDEEPGRLRASMHLPRWASRLTLLVSDVRIQRLQEISEEDALAEGCFKGKATGRVFCDSASMRLGGNEWTTCRDWYADLWETLHGEDAWAANPWIWAASFTVQHGNIDALSAAVPKREAAYA